MQCVGGILGCDQRMIVGATYGLIGSWLAIRENVLLEIKNGKIFRIVIGGDKRDADIFYEEAVLIPGFINMHTHIGDSIAREKAYGKDIFVSVARSDSLKFKILSETPKETLVEAMVTALREMAMRGIVTFFDFREGGMEGAYLMREALTRIPLNGFIMGRPDGDPLEKVLEVSDGLGLSSLNKYSDEQLVMMAEQARSLGKYVGFHASETQSQREKSIRNYGFSDVMRALRLQFDFDFVVHLTYADKHELELLTRKSKLIVFCPRANMYLGLKAPPISEAIELGALFAFGTDNVMLNSPDLFREFDAVVRLIRVEGMTPDPKLLLAAVTTIPSKALNLRTGILSEGFQADFFVFDLTKPNVAFVDDIYRAIVLRGSEMNVLQTYAAGRPLLNKEN